MKLLCRNCDITQPEYQGPICAECDGPMVSFAEPVIEFAMNAQELMFAIPEDALFAKPDTRPAAELVVSEGALFRKQAGGR